MWVSAPPHNSAARVSPRSAESYGCDIARSSAGKTTLAAAFVLQESVRAAFDKICWVSVGQEPDTFSLQNTLYRQLVNRPLPEAAKSDELVALGELKEAAKELSVRVSVVVASVRRA